MTHEYGEKFSMSKMVIPLTIMLSIFASLSVLAFINNISDIANQGDIEGLTNIAASEVVSEAENAIWVPIRGIFDAFIIKIVVLVGALFGVAIRFR